LCPRKGPQRQNSEYMIWTLAGASRKGLATPQPWHRSPTARAGDLWRPTILPSAAYGLGTPARYGTVQPRDASIGTAMHRVLRGRNRRLGHSSPSVPWRAMGLPGDLWHGRSAVVGGRSALEVAAVEEDPARPSHGVPPSICVRACIGDNSEPYTASAQRLHRDRTASAQRTNTHKACTQFDANQQKTCPECAEMDGGWCLC
jgi:hypothetical protein